MLIGGNFNKRAKQVLLMLASKSKGRLGQDMPVEILADQLNLDRAELKNVLEYMENKDLITMTSIGGPFLYGHVQITEKGLQKVGEC